MLLAPLSVTGTIPQILVKAVIMDRADAWRSRRTRRPNPPGSAERSISLVASTRGPRIQDESKVFPPHMVTP
jgi:hypothetical protein